MCELTVSRARWSTGWTAFVLLAASCCSQSRQSRAEPAVPALAPASAARDHRTDDDCPMRVPGTLLTSYSMQGGAVWLFTTKGAVEELRRRVHVLAEAYDADRASAEPIGGALAPARPLPFGTTANVTRIVDGARLEIRADYLRNAPALRDHLYRRAQAMRSTQACPLAERSVD